MSDGVLRFVCVGVYACVDVCVCLSITCSETTRTAVAGVAPSAETCVCGGVMTYSLVCVEFGQLRLVCVGVHVCVEVCVCLSMTRSETIRAASSALSPVSMCV